MKHKACLVELLKPYQLMELESNKKKKILAQFVSRLWGFLVFFFYCFFPGIYNIIDSFNLADICKSKENKTK